MPRVFLSYARADGELRTDEIRKRLAREASDIVVQQDRLLLEGGIGWWKQITDSIDSVDFLILVMTPAAMHQRQCAEGVALRPPAGRLRLPGQSRAGCGTPVRADAALDEQGALLRPRKGMAHLRRPSPQRLRYAPRSLHGARPAAVFRRPPQGIRGSQGPAPDPGPQPARRHHDCAHRRRRLWQDDPRGGTVS